MLHCAASTYPCSQLHSPVLRCAVFRLPLDELIDEVFDSLLHLRFLQGDRVTFVGDLHNQLPQLVQLTLDLEKTLGCQSKPERGQGRGKPGGCGGGEEQGSRCYAYFTHVAIQMIC